MADSNGLTKEYKLKCGAKTRSMNWAHPAFNAFLRSLENTAMPSRTCLLLALMGLLVAGCSSMKPHPVQVQILAINDFHGYLKPYPKGIRILDPNDKTKRITVSAGGAASMETALKQLREHHPNTIFVAAGDLIGASPLLSGLFHDEPTIESLSLMGLEASAVGNHEFDDGLAELQRMQNGGCYPKGGCQGPVPFKGARFQYLAANTFDTRTDKTVFPSYYVKYFDGIPMAFIGVTLKSTPKVVSPASTVGLAFKDEAQTVNALVPELKKQGIQAIAVLIHQGGYPTGDYNSCGTLAGPIVAIVKQLDKAVDLVISGHTHQAYNCIIDGRLVTSADKYGTVITDIDVQLDPNTRDVISAHANNLIVRTDTYAKDPTQAALIDEYEKLARPIALRPVGILGASLSRRQDAAGESPLGQVIADAQLAATAASKYGGAVIAFTHPGGIRNELSKSDNSQVTYADLYAAQPFGNTVVTLTLSGAQIKEMLDQQWNDKSRPRILSVSKGFTYTWDANRPHDQRVLAATVKLNGKPVDPTALYRITVNAFLASGGDGFTVFGQGLGRRVGISEVDALEHYFQHHSPVRPGVLNRIKRLH